MRGGQGGSEAKPYAVRPGYREVAQAIITVFDWAYHARAKLCRQFPVMVNIRNHHAYVACGMLRRRRAVFDLFKKQHGVFPSEHYKVAFFANDFKSERAIKRARCFYVARVKLDYELVVRGDVSIIRHYRRYLVFSITRPLVQNQEMDVLPVFTERLVLRRLQEKDVKPLVAYRSDPEVARYQNWTSVTEDEARGFIKLKQQTPFGVLGAWSQIAIALRETDTLVGDVGVCVDSEGQSAEIGFTLSASHQGKGLATEAVRRVIKLLFDETRVERVCGVTDARNTSSIALLQRLGMRLEKTEEARFKGEICREHKFVITKTDLCD